MKSLSRALLICTLLAPSLSPSLSNAAPPPGTKLAKEQVFHRGNGAEPQSLDPHKSEGVPASNIQRDLFEGLLMDSVSAEPVPGVAERWDVSDDALTYTFYLRKNAKWSNGDPVTAHDFVFSWHRVLNPATGSYYSQTLAPIKNAEQIIKGELPPEKLAVRAIDNHTLEVNLKGPTPYFLGLLTHHSTKPAHPGSVKKHGEKYGRVGNLVSNGAFILKEWVVQSHITLERNPHYWNNANTTLDKVIYYATENQGTELKRFRAGELDITDEIPVTQLRWIKKNLPEQLHITPYMGIYYYGFNLTKPPFEDTKPPFTDNIKLRQALSMAVDREIITEKVLPVGYIPAYNWVPPGVSNYGILEEYDWKALSKKERLAKARQLYKEAGYSKSNPLRVEIRYNTQENHKRLAVAIASMWKKALGAKVTIVNEEWKVFLENRKQKQVTQVFRAGWIADYNDPISFLELLHSQHGINDSAYRNPDYDQIIADSFDEPDIGKRTEILRKAERMMLEHYPAIPIYHYVSKRMIKPWVGGYVDNIMDYHGSKYVYIKAH